VKLSKTAIFSAFLYYILGTFGDTSKLIYNNMQSSIHLTPAMSVLGLGLGLGLGLVLDSLG